MDNTYIPEPPKCPECRGTGEGWDGFTVERETGQPVTYTCGACEGTGVRG